MRIGSVLYNRNTGELVSVIPPDTLQPRTDVASRWLSIDPLAHKFAAWSPYNFVMNNPVFFIDPDGREIRITITQGQYITFKDGVYKDQNGEVYKSGTNTFVDNVITSINFVLSSPTAATVINNVANATANELVLNINQTDPKTGAAVYAPNMNIDGKHPYDGSIGYDPNSASKDALNGAIQVPAISLFHEIDHADGNLTALREKQKTDKSATLYDVWLNSDLFKEKDWMYDNGEEKRVITGNETTVLKELKQQNPNMKGLDIRESHQGSSFQTKGPLSTEKKDLSPANKSRTQVKHSNKDKK
jgi:Effector protein